MEAGQDNSSFLATTIHIPAGLEASTSDRDAAQAVAAGLRDAKAPNTRRAYGRGMGTLFTAWADRPPAYQYMPADSPDCRPLPGPPGGGREVAGHHKSGPGRNLPRTCRRGDTEDRQSRPPSGRGRRPSRAGGIRLQRPHRWTPSPPWPWPGSGRPPAFPDAVAGDAWSQQPWHRPRGTVDLAIIGVMADGGLRRSEAAALTWSDIEIWPDGSARITIRKSKNQTEPATVAVTDTTARALQDIQPDGADTSTPVFALTGQTLANRVRAAASAAGLGEGFSGDSGRIGMARRMVAAGAPNAAVQNQGRWKHGDMVARYTRGEASGEALKWLT